MPIFTYADRAARKCFDHGWDEIVGMPSSMSVGPEDHDRDRLRDEVPAAFIRRWHDVARARRTSA